MIEPSERRLKKFVQHPEYKEALALTKEMLDLVPTSQGRKLQFPAVLGPMGIGKTRTCEEICERVQEEYGTTVTVFQVNVRDFSENVAPDKEQPLDTLAQALLYGRFPGTKKSNLAKFQFDDAIAKIKEAGAMKVLLHLDEIQFDRELVKVLFQACDLTMRNAHFIPVVPLASGLKSPIFKVLPSGGHVTEFELQPLALDVDDKTLPNSFCEAIGADPDSLKQAPHLLTLFALCDGRPNLIDSLIEAIKSKSSVTKLDLPNLPLEQAEDVFVEVIKKVDGTYGIVRWHSLFGGEGDDSSDIRARDSFHQVTCELIRRLLLDAYVDRYIPDLSMKVVAPPSDPALEHLKHRYPTYRDCLDSGMFTMRNNVVRIPLMILLVMDQIVNVLPHKSLRSPFDPNWGKLEVVGMTAVYLRLLSALKLGAQTMKLSELRPGAEWSGCDDVDISVPSEVRFVFLGAPIAAKSKVINEGADGLGKELELLPGTVAVAFRNQPGWDGFAFLETPDGTSLVLASQVKSREDNVGNGVPSMTRLGNAEVTDIIEKMVPVSREFASIFQQAFTEESRVVYDVFSDRLDPLDARKGLESVDKPFCLTRKGVFQRAAGAPLAETVAKRMRRSSIPGSE